MGKCGNQAVLQHCHISLIKVINYLMDCLRFIREETVSSGAETGCTKIKIKVCRIKTNVCLYHHTWLEGNHYCKYQLSSQAKSKYLGCYGIPTPLVGAFLPWLQWS